MKIADYILIDAFECDLLKKNKWRYPTQAGVWRKCFRMSAITGSKTYAFMLREGEEVVDAG